MTIKSDAIIEKATAIYNPEKDITEVLILWSNRINNPNEETYVRIDLQAGNYGVTLIEHNNITDTDKFGLYTKKQVIHGKPSNEVILKTYSSIDNGKSFSLNYEFRTPIIQVRST